MEQMSQSQSVSSHCPADHVTSTFDA